MKKKKKGKEGGKLTWDVNKSGRRERGERDRKQREEEEEEEGRGESRLWVPEMAIRGRQKLFYLAGNSVAICETAKQKQNPHRQRRASHPRRTFFSFLFFSTHFIRFL